jgi:FKBP-type peptidyl-prolyl cis-trans isomerase FkpA
MQKLFSLMLALTLLLSACNKSSTPEKCTYIAPTAVASAAEIANLKAWLDANSLTYTQHSSGIFYQILNPGSGITPVVCSNVTVKYIGRLTTSSTPFDQNTTGVAFLLGQLITGWQIGIPLVQKGGTVILYIPPSLGYGASGAGSSIPPNSNLVFSIELMDVQ